MASTDARPLHDLTGFQRDLLAAVAQLNEPNGLTIKGHLESWYTGDVRHGRLYPNLDTLVDKGLLNKGQKNRRTNEYTLTRRGQSELAAHVAWMNGDGDSQ